MQDANYFREYYQRNRERIRARDSTPEAKARQRETNRRRYLDPEKREIMHQQNKEWFEKNPKTAINSFALRAAFPFEELWDYA